MKEETLITEAIRSKEEADDSKAEGSLPECCDARLVSAPPLLVLSYLRQITNPIRSISSSIDFLVCFSEKPEDKLTKNLENQLAERKKGPRWNICSSRRMISFW